MMTITGFRRACLTPCFAALILCGCAPKIQIVAPDKPIEINLNIRIDQEVRVRLEKDIEDLLTSNPDIF